MACDGLIFARAWIAKSIRVEAGRSEEGDLDAIGLSYRRLYSLRCAPLGT
jgi:hypothetical protein